MSLNGLLKMREKVAREEADNKLKTLESREKKAAALEKELADREKHLRKEVNNKVQEKYDEKKTELLESVGDYEDQLDYKYKMLQAKYMVGFIISLIYGIVVTLIQMFKSKLFMKELQDFGHLLCDTSGWIYRRLKDMIINLWNIKIVGNATGDRGISIGIILISMIAIVFLIRFLWKYGIKPAIIENADRYMLIAVLIILVVNMMFGNVIKSILSINLILSMICEFGLVIFVGQINRLRKRQIIIEAWNKIYPAISFVIILIVGFYLIIKFMKW